MTTSQTMSLKSAISCEDAPLTPAQLGYFNARIQSKVHAEVLKLFRKLADDGKITRALIARRLRKKPEQITRWLGSSGNWTLATLSELLLAMGYEADISVRSLNDLPLSNMHHPSLAPTKALTQFASSKNYGKSVLVKEIDVVRGGPELARQGFIANLSFNNYTTIQHATND